MPRTIQVMETVEELTYLDVLGNEKVLGKIVAETYGDNEAKRFTFLPDAENPFAQKGKATDGYALGLGTGHLSFINPADAQRAGVERGLEIKDVLAYKGGLQIKTNFIDPEHRMSDVIGYDLEFWSKQRRQAGDLYALIQLDTNLRIGHMAARYNAGIYRQICENGLTSTILQLPNLAIRHSEWETNDIEESLSSIEFGTHTLMESLQRPLTNMKFLGVARRLLGRLSEESRSEEGLSQEMVFLKTRFPMISTAEGRFHNNYLEQLDLVLNNYSESDQVQGIHILNAYTNAISVERFRGSSRGAFDALENMNQVVAETVSLANMAAIFN